MQDWRGLIAIARRRLWRQRLLDATSVPLLAAGTAAVVALGLGKAIPGVMPAWWITASVLGGVALLAMIARSLRRPPSDLSAAIEVDRVLGLRAGVEEPEGEHPRRVEEGSPHREHPAPEEAHEGGPRDPRGVEEGREVVALGLEGVERRGGRGAAVTAEVEAEDAVGPREVGGDGAPHRPIAEERVEEHHRGPVARPVVVVVQRHRRSAERRHRSRA